MMMYELQKDWYDTQQTSHPPQQLYKDNIMATNFPSSPSNGATHTFGGTVYTYNSTKGVWKAAAGEAVTISDTPPSNPGVGDLWFDSSVAKTYIYYNDGSSNQWVQMNPSGGSDGADGATGGESPVILTEPPTTTQELNSDGTTSTVTMTAQDPEGFDITYGIAYKTAGNTRPSQLSADTTINQSTGVYTFTPSSTQADAGSFRARLSASDGANTTTRFVDFNLSFSFDIDYLLVAGGGAGGQGGSGGGGGGAGGLLTATRSVSPGDTLNITVGSGGAGWSTAYSTTGNAGGNSTIVHGGTTLTAYGGGFGSSAGPSPYNSPGGNGGSGGGGAQRSTSAGGVGVYPGSTYIDEPRQGYDGGVGGTGTDHGGGGGGAGGVGANSSGSSNGGAGGIGVESSITGTATYYAAGGGGAGNGNGALGGSGIGGTGAGNSPGTGNANGTAGAANTGSGGGGANYGGTSGAGADGIVIIRTLETASATTGSPTVTTDGSYNIYSFTADGSITF